MLNLTETIQRLKIGKMRLYELFEATGVEPLVKGRSKFLTEEQFAEIEQALRSSKNSEFKSQNEPRNGSETGLQPVSGHESELVKTMAGEIEHLRQILQQERELLRHEQNERAAEREERLTYQKMLTLLQQDNQKMRSQLLEAPRPHETHFESPKQEPEPEPATATVTPQEFKAEDISPETIPNRNSRGSLIGLGLSVALIVGVLSYGAITKGGNWLSDSLDKRISATLKVNGTEPDTR